MKEDKNIPCTTEFNKRDWQLVSLRIREENSMHNGQSLIRSELEALLVPPEILKIRVRWCPLLKRKANDEGQEESFARISNTSRMAEKIKDLFGRPSYREQ